MRRIKSLVVAVAVTSLSVGAAVASRSSETTPVTADFQASLSSQKQRPCGEDHMQFRLTFEGSQTSGDARLAGDLKANVRSVVNTQNGYGATSGAVVVRDPATGRPEVFRPRRRSAGAWRRDRGVPDRDHGGQEFRSTLGQLQPPTGRGGRHHR